MLLLSNKGGYQGRKEAYRVNVATKQIEVMKATKNYSLHCIIIEVCSALDAALTAQSDCPMILVRPSSASLSCRLTSFQCGNAGNLPRRLEVLLQTLLEEGDSSVTM